MLSVCKRNARDISPRLIAMLPRDQSAHAVLIALSALFARVRGLVGLTAAIVYWLQPRASECRSDMSPKPRTLFAARQLLANIGRCSGS
jgi:hypothetical protein